MPIFLYHTNGVSLLSARTTLLSCMVPGKISMNFLYSLTNFMFFYLFSFASFGAFLKLHLVRINKILNIRHIGFARGLTGCN